MSAATHVSATLKKLSTGASGQTRNSNQSWNMHGSISRMASQAYSHRTYPVPAQCLRIRRLLAVASAMLQAQGYSVSTYLFGCKTFWRRFCDFYVPNDAEFVNQSSLCWLCCGWWLVLICCERKVSLAGWWLLAGASLV